MRIADFIDATTRAETPEETFALYLKAASDLGFDRVMYSALTQKKKSKPSNRPAIMRNYPDDWIKYYVARGYVDTDPVRLACVNARWPFTWNEVIESGNFAKSELVIFDEAKEAGLYDGVAIPLHGPRGETLGVGLASSVPGTAAHRHLHRLNVVTVQFHTAFTSLSIPADDPSPVRLSPREREILSWCLIGKSSWVISEILHISEKTVEWHLSRIYAKLEVSSRIAAVVKALNLGLISQ